MANEFKVKKGLIVHGSGSTVLDIQGSQGQLFSITDDLTGTLFAVSDISGVPIFDVNADGTTTLDGNLNLGDSNKLQLGASQDLQIYHDGSNSYISELGTGDLIISADNDLTFKDGSGNIMANMNASNSVELMFGNVKKFETTNTGVTITGNITMTANATVDGVDISELPTTFAPTDAEQNVQSDWNATSGDALILNKPTIPSAITDFVSAANGGTFSGNIGIGLTANTSLHVTGASLTNNVAAVIGGGWVGNDAYHKEGGLLLISGTNTSQTGAGIAFQTRNTANTNYWKSSIIMDRDGAMRFTLGGAGTTAGSNDFTILSGGNATFAGSVSVGNDLTATGDLTVRDITAGSYTRAAQTTVSILSDAQQNSILKFREDTDTYGFTFGYYGSPNNFAITRHNNSSTGDTVISIPRDSNNVTFTGNINMAANATVDGVDLSTLPTTFAPTTAEQNVQSDWNATSGDALILNKPTIPSAITDYVSKANGGTFDGDLSVQNVTMAANKKFAHGSYLEISYGASNSSQLTFNADYDGAQTSTYTPNYSGTTSAGMSIIKMPSGGVGGLEFYVKKHGTTSGSHNLSTFNKILNLHQDGVATFSGKITSGNDIVNATAGVYTWTGDTDTYIQRSAANEITFKTLALNALVLDASQNATFAGTIGSGAITSTGKISGTELEGTSLDINGAANIDGVLDVNSGTGNTVAIFESTDDKAFIRIKDDDTDTYLISRNNKFSIGESSSDYDNFKVDITTGDASFAGSVHWDLGAGEYSGDPRAVVMGYSGGNYGQIGYNIAFSATSGAHNRVFNDIPTRIDLHDGIVVYASAAGSAGTSITWTEILEAQSNAFQYKGQDIYHTGNSSAILNSNITDFVSAASGGTFGGAITVTGELEATSLDINGNADISGALTLGTVLAAAEGGTGLSSISTLLNSNVTLSTLGAAAASHNHAATDITSGTLANARLASSVFINDGGTYSLGFAADVNTLSGFNLKRVTGFTGTDHRAFTGHHNLLTIPNTSASQYDAQLAFETGTVADGGIKFRNSSGGTWGSWYRLYHEGHLPTLAELGAASSGVVNQTDFVSAASGGTFGGNISVGTNKYNLTVNAPTSLTTSIVNDTINVTFTASTTSNVDNYLIFSSVAGGDYGLISVIPPADFGATMSIIDDSFNAGGTQAYRVYAVKNGVYSSPLTGSQTFTVGTVEPTNMSVINLNTAYYIQYDAPSAKGRFVASYNIYKHEHATASSLARASASLVYSGINNSYMYGISGVDNNNFHQFWVEVTTT